MSSLHKDPRTRGNPTLVPIALDFETHPDLYCRHENRRKPVLVTGANRGIGQVLVEEA